LSTTGYIILGVGFTMAAAVLIYSLFRGKKAPDNPWGAATLEWKCCSPPTTANFEIQPWVGSPYVYDDFVYDPDEGGYVEVLPDLHRSGKTAETPAAPATH
jgi:cytochrome c oxidase subunit 1